MTNVPYNDISLYIVNHAMYQQYRPQPSLLKIFLIPDLSSDFNNSIMMRRLLLGVSLLMDCMSAHSLKTFCLRIIVFAFMGPPSTQWCEPGCFGFAGMGFPETRPDVRVKARESRGGSFAPHTFGHPCVLTDSWVSPSFAEPPCSCRWGSDSRFPAAALGLAAHRHGGALRGFSGFRLCANAWLAVKRTARRLPLLHIIVASSSAAALLPPTRAAGLAWGWSPYKKVAFPLVALSGKRGEWREGWSSICGVVQGLGSRSRLSASCSLFRGADERKKQKRHSPPIGTNSVFYPEVEPVRKGRCRWAEGLV